MARTPITRRWTPEEIEKLKALLESGATPRAIAFQLRRNVNAVRSKITKIQRAPQAEEPAAPKKKTAPLDERGFGVLRAKTA